MSDTKAVAPDKVAMDALERVFRDGFACGFVSGRGGTLSAHDAAEFVQASGVAWDAQRAGLRNRIARRGVRP